MVTLVGVKTNLINVEKVGLKHEKLIIFIAKSDLEKLGYLL